MALFNFKKKMEEADKCCCGGNMPCEITENTNCSNSNVTIKVLGSGCKNCHALFENVKAAVNLMGKNVNIEYVTDMEKIMSYGVMSMPALVVNEKVVSMGKVLKPIDIEKILRDLGY